MEAGNKIIIPLNASLDTDSGDMLCPLENPKVIFNRQFLQGKYLPTSLRYEANGWFAGWCGYDFAVNAAAPLNGYTAGGNKSTLLPDLEVKRRASYVSPVFHISSDDGAVSFDYYPLTTVVKNYNPIIISLPHLASGYDLAHLTGTMLASGKAYTLDIQTNGVTGIPTDNVRYIEPNSTFRFTAFTLNGTATTLFAGLYIPTEAGEVTEYNYTEYYILSGSSYVHPTSWNASATYYEGITNILEFDRKRFLFHYKVYDPTSSFAIKMPVYYGADFQFGDDIYEYTYNGVLHSWGEYISSDGKIQGSELTNAALTNVTVAGIKYYRLTGVLPISCVDTINWSSDDYLVDIKYSYLQENQAFLGSNTTETTSEQVTDAQGNVTTENVTQTIYANQWTASDKGTDSDTSLAHKPLLSEWGNSVTHGGYVEVEVPIWLGFSVVINATVNSGSTVSGDIAIPTPTKFFTHFCVNNMKPASTSPGFYAYTIGRYAMRHLVLQSLKTEYLVNDGTDIKKVPTAQGDNTYAEKQYGAPPSTYRTQDFKDITLGYTVVEERTSDSSCSFRMTHDDNRRHNWTDWSNYVSNNDKYVELFSNHYLTPYEHRFAHRNAGTNSGIICEHSTSLDDTSKKLMCYEAIIGCENGERQVTYYNTIHHPGLGTGDGLGISSGGGGGSLLKNTHAVDAGVTYGYALGLSRFRALGLDQNMIFPMVEGYVLSQYKGDYGKASRELLHALILDTNHSFTPEYYAYNTSYLLGYNCDANYILYWFSSNFEENPNKRADNKSFAESSSPTMVVDFVRKGITTEGIDFGSVTTSTYYGIESEANLFVSKADSAYFDFYNHCIEKSDSSSAYPFANGTPQGLLSHKYTPDGISRSVYSDSQAAQNISDVFSETTYTGTIENRTTNYSFGTSGQPLPYIAKFKLKTLSIPINNSSWVWSWHGNKYNDQPFNLQVLYDAKYSSGNAGRVTYSGYVEETSGGFCACTMTFPADTNAAYVMYDWSILSAVEQGQGVITANADTSFSHAYPIAVGKTTSQNIEGVLIISFPSVPNTTVLYPSDVTYYSDAAATIAVTSVGQGITYYSAPNVAVVPYPSSIRACLAMVANVTDTNEIMSYVAPREGSTFMTLPSGTTDFIGVVSTRYMIPYAEIDSKVKLVIGSYNPYIATNNVTTANTARVAFLLDTAHCNSEYLNPESGAVYDFRYSKWGVYQNLYALTYPKDFYGNSLSIQSYFKYNSNTTGNAFMDAQQVIFSKFTNVDTVYSYVMHLYTDAVTKYSACPAMQAGRPWEQVRVAEFKNAEATSDVREYLQNKLDSLEFTINTEVGFKRNSADDHDNDSDVSNIVGNYLIDYVTLDPYVSVNVIKGITTDDSNSPVQAPVDNLYSVININAVEDDLKSQIFYVASAGDTESNITARLQKDNIADYFEFNPRQDLMSVSSGTEGATTLMGGYTPDTVKDKTSKSPYYNACVVLPFAVGRRGPEKYWYPLYSDKYYPNDNSPGREYMDDTTIARGFGVGFAGVAFRPGVSTNSRYPKKYVAGLSAMTFLQHPYKSAPAVGDKYIMQGTHNALVRGLSFAPAFDYVNVGCGGDAGGYPESLHIFAPIQYTIGGASTLRYLYFATQTGYPVSVITPLKQEAATSTDCGLPITFELNNDDVYSSYLTPYSLPAKVTYFYTNYQTQACDIDTWVSATLAAYDVLFKPNTKYAPYASDEAIKLVTFVVTSDGVEEVYFNGSLLQAGVLKGYQTKSGDVAHTSGIAGSGSTGANKQTSVAYIAIPCKGYGVCKYAFNYGTTTNVAKNLSTLDDKNASMFTLSVADRADLRVSTKYYIDADNPTVTNTDKTTGAGLGSAWLAYNKGNFYQVNSGDYSESVQEILLTANGSDDWFYTCKSNTAAPKYIMNASDLFSASNETCTATRLGRDDGAVINTHWNIKSINRIRSATVVSTLSYYHNLSVVTGLKAVDIAYTFNGKTLAEWTRENGIVNRAISEPIIHVEHTNASLDYYLFYNMTQAKLAEYFVNEEGSQITYAVSVENKNTLGNRDASPATVSGSQVARVGYSSTVSAITYTGLLTTHNAANSPYAEVKKAANYPVNCLLKYGYVGTISNR